MQIVVNCETHLCSQFLGPGDNFFAKLWRDFYGSGSRRIGQSDGFLEYAYNVACSREHKARRKVQKTR